MLYYNTVEPGTISLLKRLQSLEVLSNFSLVGGTALSLKYGHRISVDLDLFSEDNIDKEKIIEALRLEFGDSFIPEISPAKWAVFSYIDNVKVDIVSFKHPLIRLVSVEDSIRTYSTEDIIAMKINAILGRGKKKDFWDIYELLNHYTIKEMIEFHREKFPTQMLLISIPNALTYFVDADESEDPVSLKGQTWDGVKKLISKKVNEYLK